VKATQNVVEVSPPRGVIWFDVADPTRLDADKAMLAKHLSAGTPAVARAVTPAEARERLARPVYVLSALLRGKPPCGKSGKTTSSSFSASPVVLFTVAPHTLPSGESSSAQTCPC
jgi:hypothetical protein